MNDERWLVRQAQRGRTEAFEELYKRQVARVYGLCLRMVSDPARAEELTQDVFLQAWQKLDSFDGRSQLSSWLHRIAVNVAWSDIRSRLRRRELRELKGLKELSPLEPGLGGTLSATVSTGSKAATREGSTKPHPGHTPHSDQTSAATAIDLERAVGSLPPGARAVFVLYQVYGNTHPEIADSLGISVGGSKAQLHRARKLLRQKLASPMHPDDAERDDAERSDVEL